LEGLDKRRILTLPRIKPRFLDRAARIRANYLLVTNYILHIESSKVKTDIHYTF
jgi:hypothetical protein